MYGPGSPLRALKHRQVSSTKTGPPILFHVVDVTYGNDVRWKEKTYSSGSPPAFVLGNLLDGALDFDQVEGTTSQGNNVPKNGLDFGQFVRVAGDEVEFGGSHDVSGCWDTNVLDRKVVVRQKSERIINECKLYGSPVCVNQNSPPRRFGGLP